MSVAETIREAAEYIERNGMTKGCLRDVRGRTCMLGAIKAVGGAGAIHSLDGAGDFMDSWMERNLGSCKESGFRATAFYNDLPSTSQQDVLLWMKKAAGEAEEQGL